MLKKISHIEDILDTKKILLQDKNVSAEFFDKKFINLMNNKTDDQKAKELYNTYLDSYFNACLELRNRMVITENWNLYYPYIFLLLHTIEMTLKYLKVYDVNGFSTLIANHNILNTFKDNKNNLINLGINNDIYDEFVNLLSVIDDYTTKDDLAVSFKYTLERDFSTPIITNSLINLSAEDIKNNVENEKKILLICKIIKIVAQTSNYHDVNNDFANNIKIMEDALQNILNELSK